MTYHVRLSKQALNDLDDLYFLKNVSDSTAAAGWFNGLQEAIESLDMLPDRCSLAPESCGTKREIRHLLYGSKPHVYRVIYEVDESTRVVKVFHIRHGARLSLVASDL